MSLIVNNLIALLHGMKDDDLIQSYFYCSPTKTNIKTDSVNNEDCFAALYTITESTVDVSSNMVREKASVNIFFLIKQKEIDFDGLQNEQLIDTCKTIAINFISRIRKEYKHLRIDTDSVNMKNCYDKFDKNTTGVSIEMTIADLRGRCTSGNVCAPVRFDKDNDGNIVLTCATDNATIHYSTDNEETTQIYSIPLVLDDTDVIIAYATKENYETSRKVLKYVKNI